MLKYFRQNKYTDKQFVIVKKTQLSQILDNIRICVNRENYLS